MANQPIVLRILPDVAEKVMDWTVQPNLVSFNETLIVINKILENSNIQAFEYDDEDGDRITVRSDEEMQAMLSSYLSLLEENSSTVEPLIIYPRVPKSPGHRNIHGLKVNTGVENANSEEMEVGDKDSGGSRKQESRDIEEILACGAITDKDLQYLEIMGAGNAGTVYKAYHRPLSTVLAVKVISLDIPIEVKQQIISELEILHRCDSPVIIGFYGAYFQENRIFMCTEFMDGGSLDKYGQIEEEVLGRVAISVVQGLIYLWGLKIMHRDVKPSNILVNTRGDIKLCDFGVSVQLIDSIAKTFVGTNVYMAPERIRGEDYRITSEVWSLGLTLYELAMGRFPYSVPSANPALLLKTIVKDDVPPLPTQFSPEFREFVSLCVRKDPKTRPPPDALMSHPFIQSYMESAPAAVAAWVQRRLLLHQQMLLQQQKQRGHRLDR